MPFVIDPKTGNAKHTSDDFVVCDDLNGKDVVATIERIESKLATLQEGRKCERIHVYFKGGTKPLLLNATNTKMLISIYGKRAADWKGKRITLHPDTCKMKGMTVDCIRIHAAPAAKPTPSGPAATRQSQAPAAPPEPAPLETDQERDERLENERREAAELAQSEPGEGG